MRNLLTRIATGLVAGGLVIFLFYLGPPGVWLFCLVISLAGLLEFFRITGMINNQLSYLVLALAFMFWLLAWFCAPPFRLSNIPELHVSRLPVDGLFFFVTALLIVSLLVGAIWVRMKDPVRELAIMGLGWLYVVFPFVCFLLLNKSGSIVIETGAGGIYGGNDGYADVGGPAWEDANFPGIKHGMGLLFLIWASDIFAYFGGKLFGRRPFFQRISPKKTWEGTLTGAVFCLLVAFLLEEVWPSPVMDWRLTGLLVAIFSPLGDLAESLMKRKLDLKDSGSLLPGHGGILDRFDGFLVATPVVYAYVVFANWILIL